MSTLYVDNLQPNLGSGVSIPGHVVQVVSFDTTGNLSFSSTSYTDTPISITITPKEASSKIYVVAHANMFHNSGQRDVMVSLFRGATQLSPGAYGQTMFYLASATGLAVPFTVQKLDSPATTSPVTYTIKARLDSASGTGQININGSQATITAMEIAQ